MREFPLCYVSFAIDEDAPVEDVIPQVTRLAGSLCERGWSPVLSIGSWFDSHRDKLDESSLPGSVSVVSACLAQLARVEALVLLPGWERSERSRVDKEFAEMNGIVIFEADEISEDVVPPAREFREKYIQVEISHRHGTAV